MGTPIRDFLADKEVQEWVEKSVTSMSDFTDRIEDPSSMYEVANLFLEGLYKFQAAGKMEAAAALSMATRIVYECHQRGKSTKRVMMGPPIKDYMAEKEMQDLVAEIQETAVEAVQRLKRPFSMYEISNLLMEGVKHTQKAGDLMTAKGILMAFGIVYGCHLDEEKEKNQ